MQNSELYSHHISSLWKESASTPHIVRVKVNSQTLPDFFLKESARSSKSFLICIKRIKVSQHFLRQHLSAEDIHKLSTYIYCRFVSQTYNRKGTIHSSAILPLNKDGYENPHKATLYRPYQYRISGGYQNDFVCP